MKPFLIVLIILFGLILISILIFIFINKINKKMYSKRFGGDIRYKFQSIRDFPGLKSKNLHIDLNTKERINGKLFYYDRKEYKAVIIFYHGLYSGYLNYINLINELSKNGYKVVAFDMYGTMSSEGDSLKSMCLGDSISKRIIEFVENDLELGKYPIYTLGHSYGGHLSVISTLHSDKIIKSAAFSPYNSNVDACYSLKPGLIILSPFIYVYDLFKFGHYSTYTCKDAINYSNAKFLIFHGEKDVVVKYKYSMKKLLKSKINNNLENVSLITYKDRNHFIYMSKEGSLNYQKEVMFPRTSPINFNGIRYDLVNKLDEDSINKLIEFFNN